MKCTRKFKKSWKCIISHDNMDSDEPCGLVPRWWNRSRDANQFRKDMKW